jgi:hypothetical protein
MLIKRGNIVSDYVEIFSGVHQGSAMGILLYALDINDLPREIVNVTELFFLK